MSDGTISIAQEIQRDREKGANRLVAEYRDRLYAAALSLCGDAIEAEDLVFRTFEQVIDKIDEYREEQAFYGWMFTINRGRHRDEPSPLRQARPWTAARRQSEEEVGGGGSCRRRFCRSSGGGGSCGEREVERRRRSQRNIRRDILRLTMYSNRRSRRMRSICDTQTTSALRT